MLALTCNTKSFWQGRCNYSPLLHSCEWGEGYVFLIVKCYMFIYLQKHGESKKQIYLDIREIGQHLSCLSAVSAKKACKHILKVKSEWRFHFAEKKKKNLAKI